MAAGSGSRYGKLKQFDELGPKGEFLMEFSIYDAIKNGFNHIVLITKKENKDFLYEYLRDKIDNSIKIDVVVQEINNLPNNIIADSVYASVVRNFSEFCIWTSAKSVLNVVVITEISLLKEVLPDDNLRLRKPFPQILHSQYTSVFV